VPAFPARLIGAVHQIVRAEARLPALWRARMRAGDIEMKVILRNVSASGFMGEAPAHIQAGSAVTLLLPIGAPLIADVRWALNGRIGCRLRGRFDWRQRALLALCGLANGLFTSNGVKMLVALGAVAIVLLA
jgi:hypothetical protein